MAGETTKKEQKKGEEHLRGSQVLAMRTRTLQEESTGRGRHQGNDLCAEAEKHSNNLQLA